MDPTGFAEATSARLLCVRRHRLRRHHRDERDLVRPHRSRVGPRAFRALHLIGGYYLWLQFMVSFGKRIPAMPAYAPFLIPLVAVIALRMIAMARIRAARHGHGELTAPAQSAAAPKTLGDDPVDHALGQRPRSSGVASGPA